MRCRVVVCTVFGCRWRIAVACLQRRASDALVVRTCLFARVDDNTLRVLLCCCAPSVLCLSFNPKQRKLLAAGDASGRVAVWRLGWRLSNEQANEAVQLKRLVAAANAE